MSSAVAGEGEMSRSGSAMSKFKRSCVQIIEKTSIANMITYRKWSCTAYT